MCDKPIPQLYTSKEHFNIGNGYSFLSLPFPVDFIENKKNLQGTQQHLGR
jgi:hypothetical protein